MGTPAWKSFLQDGLPFAAAVRRRFFRVGRATWGIDLSDTLCLCPGPSRQCAIGLQRQYRGGRAESRVPPLRGDFP